jgi:tetratricopeptide (TPR) repeat protein
MEENLPLLTTTRRIYQTLNFLGMNTSLFKTVFVATILFSCAERNATPSKELISQINLKTGTLISCGPADQQFGNVDFNTSCGKKVKETFNLGVKLLHSFEYDEAEKVFASIINEEPSCAMAYWGVAMANFHPLWTPPSKAELEKGSKAIRIAQSLDDKDDREQAYISAIASFYNSHESLDHRTRAINFENASAKVAQLFPNDNDAKVFYALSLLAAADPTDKSYVKQKKANEILSALYKQHPDHPGIVHYLIHANDYPELAAAAIPMANRYASVAPSSAHALHMPSHIFTRLGMWKESIESNLASADAAKCYAQSAGIKGHWDEELHALDYLAYAYLQRGDNLNAQKVLELLDSIETVSPMNFKVAYAFATIPARFALENRLWYRAASLDFKENVPWQEHGWQKAIVHYARSLGLARSGRTQPAKNELKEMDSLYDHFVKTKDAYKAAQVKIMATTARAWISMSEKKNEEAIELMKVAADLESKTEKHPVTPGEVLPAMELLGDMYLLNERYAEALIAYQENFKRTPNRFNGLYGAAKAAQLTGNDSLAGKYFQHLVTLAENASSDRIELADAKKNLTRR